MTKLKMMLMMLGMLSTTAFAGPPAFNFSGTLQSTAAGHAAIVDSNVTMVLQIYNKAQNCLLYEETQTVNTSTTNGDFSVQVGSAKLSAKRTGGDLNLSMDQVFQGVGYIASCYTAAVGDERYLKVTVTPSSTGTSESLSFLPIHSVPMAMVADTLSPGSKIHGDLILDTNGAIQLNGGGAGNVGFKAPSVSTNTIWTLPNSIGSNGMVLTSDGAGNLIWTTPASSTTQSGLTNFSFNSNSDGSGSDGGFNFQSNGTSIFQISNSGALTTAGPITSAAGPLALSATANQNINLTSSGTGLINLGSTNGASLTVQDGGGLTVNAISVKGSQTGLAPVIGLTGSDTNISLGIVPKGTGAVGIGTTAPISGSMLDVWGQLRLKPVTPGTGGAGMIAYDSSANALKYHNGSSWLPLGSTWQLNGANAYYSAGSVGIGTTTPASALSVATSASYVADFSTTNTVAYLALKNGLATYPATISQGATGSGDMSFYVNNLEGLRIAGTTPDVQVLNHLGIGAATAPGRYLDVSSISGTVYTATGGGSSPGTGINSPTIRVSSTGPTDGYTSVLEMATKNSSSVTQTGYIGTVSITGAAQYAPAMIFGSTNGPSTRTERMRIDQNGNVGIGTTAPAAPLHSWGGFLVGNPTGGSPLTELRTCSGTTTTGTTGSFTCSGVAVGSTVNCSPSSATGPGAGIVWSTYVQTAGTISFNFSSTATGIAWKCLIAN